MPKKKRITAATTTATRPIIAPKRGPSPPSMQPQSSQVLERRRARGGVCPHQVGDQIDRAGAKHGAARPRQLSRALERPLRLSYHGRLAVPELRAQRGERGGRERARV